MEVEQPLEMAGAGGSDVVDTSARLVGSGEGEGEEHTHFVDGHSVCRYCGLRASLLTDVELLQNALQSNQSLLDKYKSRAEASQGIQTELDDLVAEHSKLRSRFTQLDHDHRTQSAEYDMLQSQLAELRAEVVRSTERADSATRAAQLKDKLLRQMVNQLQVVRTFLQLERSTLRDVRQETTLHVQAVSEASSAVVRVVGEATSKLASKLGSHEQERQRSVARQSEMQTELSVAQMKVVSLTGERDEWKEKYEHLVEDAQTHQTAKVSAEEALAVLQADYERLKNQLNLTTQSVDQVQQNVDESERLRSQAEQRLSQAQQEAEDMRTEITALRQDKTQLGTLQKKLVEQLNTHQKASLDADAERETLHSQVQALTEQLRSAEVARERAEDAAAAAGKERERAASELLLVQQEIQDTKQLRESRDARQQELEAERNAAMDASRAAEEAVQDLEIKLRTATVENESRVRGLQSDVKRLDDANRELAGENHTLRTRSKAAEGTAGELQERVDLAESHARQLQSELADERAAKTEAQSRLLAVEVELEQTRQRLQGLEDARKGVEGLEATMIRLTEIAREKDTEITRLQALVQKECTERCLLIEEHKSLQQQLQALQQQHGLGAQPGPAAGHGHDPALQGIEATRGDVGASDQYQQESSMRAVNGDAGGDWPTGVRPKRHSGSHSNRSRGAR